ncbi:MAG: PNGase F N-terminal domain-containing protein [Marinifilaceae bacterium]
MKNYYQVALFSVIVLVQACTSTPIKTMGDRHIAIFQDEQINWGHPESNDSILPNRDGIIRLTGGRILLKKINVPHFEKSTKVNARLRLVSNGDPWDKSGSLFVLPKESVINLLNIQKQELDFPSFKVGNEDFPGIVQGKDYLPTLELMRFMTPFGVGFYSEDPKIMQRKPVYIPHWEKEVVWEQDITDRLNQLEGEVWVGIWIDVWTREGYKVSLDLTFEESKIPNHKRKIQWTSPLVNTINYFGPMEYPDFFSRNDLTMNFEVPKNVENLRLKYIVSGHGGHSGGDEFVKNENVISIDGREVYRFIPWRDDCASFRRFNPHSGVWTEKATWKGKEIDERIASSDYSRSNWCPGTDIPPVEIPLEGLTFGQHQLTISIPKAQPIKKNELNHWLVSAYLVGDLKE